MRLLLLVTFICFSVSNLSAQILKNVSKGALKEMRNTSRGATRVLRRGTKISPTLPQTGVAATRTVPSVAQSALQGPSMPQNMATHPLTTHGLEAPVVPESHLQIQSEMATPQEFIGTSPEENELLQQFQAEVAANEHLLQESANYQFGGLDTGFGRSVLIAPVAQRNAQGDVIKGGYSVTVVKTHVQGKEEIFGVIATHVLPDATHNRLGPGMLSTKFQVQVKDVWSGKDVLYDAQVVQVSPSSTLDISLVKFEEEVEWGAFPLEIADTPTQLNERLFSYGFTAGEPYPLFSRQVLHNSFLSVQTDQNIAGDRQGFCGSPLLDATGKVKAIHTGTKFSSNTPDVSYGTHAHFINSLVEAYYNEGNAAYDLEIKGQTLARLNVDEYIDGIYIYNTSGKLVVQKNIVGGTKNSFPKFSESMLSSLLESTPDAGFLLFRTKRILLGEDGIQSGKKWDREKKKNIDSTKAEHWYNLQTQQIEETRPTIIKI